MSQVVRKFFMDFEKEEAWLNEMSAKGWALVEHSWARYVFEESTKGSIFTGLSCWRRTLRRRPATCNSWRRPEPSVCHSGSPPRPIVYS